MWKFITNFFVSILLTFTLPVLCLSFVPFVLYRYFVKICAIWFAPMEKILDPISTYVGGNDIYSGQVRSGAIAVTLNGRVDLDQVCDSFHEKVINFRKANGEFNYPQLQQCVRKLMGFLFWEFEKDFDVKAHVEVWNQENPSLVVTQESFKSIINTILNTDFDPEKSPWKLYIVNNTRILTDPPGVGNKTTLVFHFHHVLGGGVEIMNEQIFNSWFYNNAAVDEMSEEPHQTPDYHCHKSINWKLISNYFQLLMFGSYEFVSTFLTRRQTTDWSSKGNYENLDTELNLHISETLPISLLRDIRSIHGTSLVSIILGAYAGALRRFMIQHLIKPPSKINCTVHSEENTREPIIRQKRGTTVDVTIPINDDLNPLSSKEKIQVIQKRLLRATKSTAPLINPILELILGSLPPCLTEILRRYRNQSETRLINVSGLAEKQILCNTDVVGILPFERCPPSLQGPSLICIRYGGSVHFILCSDTSILHPSLPLKDLNTFIFKELNDMIRLDVVLYV